MKIKHVIINVLPFLGWMIYLFIALRICNNYYNTTVLVMGIIPLITLLFIVYNLLVSDKILYIIINDLIFGISYICGGYLALNKLLVLSHMSDEYRIPSFFYKEGISYILIFIFAGLLIKHIIRFFRKKSQ